MTLIPILSALWLGDGFYQHGLAVKALAAAGFSEHVTTGSWRWLCPPGSRATLFLAQGRGLGERQGYVCTSHFRAAVVHEVPWSEPMGLDWH